MRDVFVIQLLVVTDLELENPWMFEWNPSEDDLDKVFVFKYEEEE
jgi:hypothetical protein